MVDVILLERIERLGQMGDVVTVKPGFARNFLLPQKKAMRATKGNLAAFEGQKAQLVADNLKRKAEAEAAAAKMGDVRLTTVRQAGESGQLYGSVTARDIAEVITAGGYTVSRSQVVIETPIKTVGVFPVRVTLHPEVSVTVTIAVAQSADEAQALLRGEALKRPGDEDDDEDVADDVAAPDGEAEAASEAEPNAAT